MLLITLAWISRLSENPRHTFTCYWEKFQTAEAWKPHVQKNAARVHRVRRSIAERCGCARSIAVELAASQPACAGFAAARHYRHQHRLQPASGKWPQDLGQSGSLRTSLAHRRQ